MDAIILAGGKGQRLRPLTNDRPKPMVELAGKPIIVYQLEWMRREGIRSIAISCGYLHHVLQDYLGDGSAWGLDLHYAVEETPLGRGGGIKHAFSLLDPGDAPVLIANGDLITDLRLSPVLAQHRADQALATVVLTPFHSPFGVVDLDGRDRILGFREKPVLPYWINGGIYLFERGAVEHLPDLGDVEDLTFPRLAAMGRLLAFRYTGFWRSIDTVKDVTTVGEELLAFPPATAPVSAIPPFPPPGVSVSRTSTVPLPDAAAASPPDVAAAPSTLPPIADALPASSNSPAAPDLLGVDGYDAPTP